MKILDPQTFVNPYFEREDILGVYENEPMGVQILKLHEQREKEVAYAFLTKDFSCGMKEQDGEAILQELGFKLAATKSYTSSVKIEAKLWLHKASVCIAETQGSNSHWYARIYLHQNGTENNLLCTGGSRHPYTLVNGDICFSYSFTSENGVKPLLEQLLPTSEYSWPENSSYLAPQVSEWKELIEQHMPIVARPQGHLVYQPGEVVVPLEKQLSRCGLPIKQTMEEFLVTHQFQTRYWFQFENGRVTSYHGDYEDACKLLAEEKKIMEHSINAGATHFERHNNQYQISNYISFQYKGSCAKCSLIDGNPVLLDYCSSKPLPLE